MDALKHEPPTSDRVPVRWSIVAVLALAILLPMARVIGLVAWPWTVALLPLTGLGVIVSLFGGGMLLGPRFPLLGRLFTGAREEQALTPPPDRLEPPSHAKAGGEPILDRYPEILAAVCHGLRFRRLLPRVVGHPTSDPWGVYAAFVTAAPADFEELRMAAALHTRRFATTKKKGKAPSDSEVLKVATDAFRRCAARLEAGKVHPDCTFEHVTVMFGAQVPSRDRQLKAIAPKLRKLLEDQFPQLATASLSDGSAVKFEEWQRRAARDREALESLRKEHERLQRRMEQLQAELDDARAYGDAMRESVDAIREKARMDAREEQEAALDALRDALDDQRVESQRNSSRFTSEKSRIEATLEKLTKDHQAMEAALFSAFRPEEPDDREIPGVEKLAGLRVLLVGGEARQVPTLRSALEAHGAQLVHQDGASATQLVAGSHRVVLWIRWVGHTTAFAVKHECDVRGVPIHYWSRTSPASLLALLAEGS